MRPRITVTAEQILAALHASDGDLEGAAEWLDVVCGIAISGRTLRRRMGEFGIRPRSGFERVGHEEAA